MSCHLVLQVHSVAICGVGNVALDCSRVLLKGPAQLAPTDLAAHALQQLSSHSAVREVHLVARRGPVQVGGSMIVSCMLTSLRGCVGNVLVLSLCNALQHAEPPSACVPLLPPCWYSITASKALIVSWCVYLA